MHTRIGEGLEGGTTQPSVPARDGAIFGAPANTRFVDYVVHLKTGAAPAKHSRRMEISAMQIGSVMLVGIEAEPFNDYQVNISQVRI